MPLPLLLAATPIPSDAFVPFTPPAAQAAEESAGGDSGRVEVFDPVARAALIASELPRQWRGSYQSFSGGGVVPVQLSIDAVRATGQMVDFRGTITIASVTSPMQANINAKSDQLDMLLLGSSNLPAGLEAGGAFLGLQGLTISGWHAPRLTAMGGRLQLAPTTAGGAQAVSGPRAVRGLW